MFKEYGEEDYWAIDERGVKYATTPEYDVMGTLGWIILLSMSIMPLLALTLSF